MGQLWRSWLLALALCVGLLASSMFLLDQSSTEPLSGSRRSLLEADMHGDSLGRLSSAAEAPPPLAPHAPLLAATLIEPTASNGSAAPRPRQQLCAIYNGQPYHMDVAAGLAWAFQAAGCKTDVYIDQSSRGLEIVMESWFRGRVHHHREMEAAMGQYDLIVMATYPEPPSMLGGQQSLFVQRRPTQRFLLAVHNPGWLLQGAAPRAPLLPLAQRLTASQAGSVPQPIQPVQLLALAPSTASYISSLVGAWAADLARWLPGWEAPSGPVAGPEVPWIAPLLPWSPANETSSGSGLASQGEGVHLGPLANLCIQGTIDPKRRDYASAFAAAAHPAVLAQLRRRDERLLLVGEPRVTVLKVPRRLHGRVQAVPSLQYQEYYETLSRCRAILTAFGSETYLINKTSSSMAAALLVGTPLVTEDRVLRAYQYVPNEAALTYHEPGEPGPDPAALAAAEGIRQAGQLHPAGRQAAPRRLLVETPAASAADGGQQTTGQVKEEAVDSQLDAQDAEAPPAGSYAAALLKALHDDASRAAHTAAWRAKRVTMQRNVQTARQVLRDTAAWAAAARLNN